MLTQLATVKLRLGLSDLEIAYDALLVMFIDALTPRFDYECNRTLARTENARYQFAGDDREVLVPCYPVESISKFEWKQNETDGWQERENVRYLLREGGVISLEAPLGTRRSLARVTYTGGYVLPPGPPDPGQTALPKDLEQAAVEQVAWWFQNRDRMGLERIWEYHGTYRQFADMDLVSPVRAVLGRYRRVTL